ncbi:MAG TPA: cytidylate kinase-like family protein [Verrucomicrobiae bacterium]|nr:cytidylate kinase-like family protein [Verrucomicrobiae bacterium]
MNINFIAEKSNAYVVSEWRERHLRKDGAGEVALNPAITFSYQTGVGMREIAERLAQALHAIEPRDDREWMVFDQQLIEKALDENFLPRELAGRITEDKRLFLDELVDDLFGLCPPSWVLVPQVVQTILRLAVGGHVILIGHGVTIVTAKLPNVYHVRLTGSLPRRIARVQHLRNFTPKEAAQYVHEKDRGRERYVKAHFHTRLDDEMHYDLVLNTDRFSANDAAALVAAGAHCFFAATNGSAS